MSLKHTILSPIRRALGIQACREELAAVQAEMRQATRRLEALIQEKVSRPWGQQIVTLPVDHLDVVQPNPPGYRYRHIEAVMERHRESITAFLDELAPHMVAPFLDAITDDAIDDTTPHWKNNYFREGDGRVACGMVGLLKPRKIIEIGSGNSTKYFRYAINGFGAQTTITSIDPAPRAEIDVLADTIIRSSVKDVDTSLFESLEPGDILFLDGSHLAFNGTDTTHFFLEILPVVAPGVHVHVHDIPLPGEYGLEFTRRYYNEQYLLAVLLLASPTWRPTVPLSWLQSKGLVDHGGGSFWLVQDPA
jgi:predicted O-methyltransferase YrrM